MDSGSPAARSLPCMLMRGGTSRGPFFLAADLPSDVAERDRVLLRAMGSPHPIQVDGIGGSHAVTSKVAIISPSSQDGADVDYLFAQVSVTQAQVDTSPNCGNMLTAVGPFAIEKGLVPATGDETVVRIFNRNTSALVEAVIQTPGGRVRYDGDLCIDGVNEPAAPIKLKFEDASGSKTGALFPTGERMQTLGGYDVTLIDYAMPMMLVRAQDFGLRGDESAEEIDAMPELFRKVEAVRLEAGKLMGLGDVSEKVIPKVGLLSQPRKGGTITSRYLMPHRAHQAHAVTGGLCVGAALSLDGTVASPLADRSRLPLIEVEHPSGKLELEMTTDGEKVLSASLVRTARKIMDGTLFL